MIEFAGQADRGMFIRAQRLHMRGLFWAAAIFFVLGLYLVITGPKPTSWPFLFLPAAAIFVYLTPYLGAYTTFRTSKVVSLPIRGTATEKGMTFDTELGHSEVAWPMYHRARLGKDLVLLYLSSNMFQMIGRHYFADEAGWNAFRELVRTGVKPKKGSAVVLTAVLWLVIIMLVYLLWALVNTR